MSGAGRKAEPGRPAGVTEKDSRRRARLAELKRQIAAGRYESPEKLEVTIRRMLTDLRKGAE